MQDFKHRQKKIQEKRKNTPFRDYVKEIVSWFPMVFHKTQWHMSRYPDTDRIGTLSSNHEFEKIRDTMLEYGKEYDPQKWFFKQMHMLMKSIPLWATIRQMAGENTAYADTVVGSSHVYLSSAIINDCHDVLYSFVIFDYCNTVIDSLYVGTYSENIYNSVGIVKSSNIFYSRYITNSSNVWFSVNLMWCHDCLGCIGLENKSYCIRNKQYTREEYLEQKKKFLQQKSGFEKVIANLPIKSNNYGSKEIQGNHIVMSNNVKNWYFVNRLENGHNVICVWWENQEKNFYDMFDAGVSSTDMYACEWAGSHSNNIYCSTQIERSSNIFYSYYLVNCSYCLWCVGLQNKQFCIFNKQYTKEERHEQVDEIFRAMEKDGTLGKFFPWWMNPFYFNDTAASLIENYNKEEIISDGYLRRDDVVKVDIPEWIQTVKTTELDQFESFDSEWNWTIDDKILKTVIMDEKGNVYRVIPMELKFLRKYGLPLPRKHRLERLKGHFRVK